MLLISHAPASALQAVLAALILFLPCALLLPAWLASRRTPRPDKAWPLAQGISLLALLTALVLLQLLRLPLQAHSLAVDPSNHIAQIKKIQLR